MKQFIDLSPALAFLVVYFATKDFMLATYILVGASAMQIALTWILWRRIEKMQIGAFLVLLPLGLLTVLFQNEQFLKWKPTLVNWIFAFVLLVGQFWGQKNLLQRLLESLFKSLPDMTLQAPDSSWRLLNFCAIAFFVLIGGLNLLVAYHFDTETWVTFKVFGLLIINLIGMVLLFWYLSRFLHQNKT